MKHIDYASYAAKDLLGDTSVEFSQIDGLLFTTMSRQVASMMGASVDHALFFLRCMYRVQRSARTRASLFACWYSNLASTSNLRAASDTLMIDGSIAECA
ncbi:hypothetical protein [Paraburkholderia kururiensis]|uniref:Uncharacterized protein n=1 Tax=Paraburkholderia kururiensis TaxID=984307 RepID=A0ABZ0WNT4_9BURK|nr:hypothetical protein [Paraburkholderia kururiensis]WQD79027.1 hypothetical protein U0042_04790 [Paraburkholderia kururiensis]